MIFEYRNRERRFHVPLDPRARIRDIYGALRVVLKDRVSC
jgi:hypothetical protein